MSSDFPDWWRGRRAPDACDWERPVFRGPLLTLDLETAPLLDEDTGLGELRFFRARARGLEVSLTDVHLSVGWSEFDGCTFRQRVKPVLNQAGIAAQGSFGSHPSIYRSCTFEQIRFKLLGGFTLGEARFEDCTFVNCRWEGSFAHSADFVRCRFVGKMNGCVWFGDDPMRPDQQPRRNEIVGNDFTETVFTDNVDWRFNYPADDQLFPSGYKPVDSTA